MEKLVSSANAYFELVENVPYRDLFRSGAVRVLFAIAAALFLSTAGYLYLKIAKQQEGAFDWLFFVTLSLELAMVVAFRYANEARNRMRIQRIGNRFNASFRNLQQARRAALRHFFGRNESQYLAFSKEIADAIALQESLREGKELDAIRMLRLIYDPDSKPRIYALLLVIVSGVTAMSIKSGADIEALFALIPQSAGKGFAELITWALVLGLLLFATYLLRVLVALALRSLVMRLERKTNGELAIRCVQRDLLRYHRFIVLGKDVCHTPLIASVANKVDFCKGERRVQA